MITWNLSRPTTPVIGDGYMDTCTCHMYVYNGTEWSTFSESESTSMESYVPTTEQLENHPSLKIAWEEFMIIRRLLGL